MFNKAILISTLFTIIQSCDFYLDESDFQYGTMRIQQSGTYCLTSKIQFNPVPGSDSDPNAPGAWFPTDDSLYQGSEDQISGPYALGFFAAITIEASNVVLDLQGNKIEYSEEFYLQQRWGSIIEIGNSAFIPSTGPANFEGDGFIAVDNIEIRNGKLGLTSHHSIHSNGASNVYIHDLIIEDFELCAVQLNGFNGATLENLKIGEAYDKVPFTGYYSAGRFLLLPLRQLLTAIDDNGLSIPSMTFNGGRTLTLGDVVSNLVESLDLIYRIETKDITKETWIDGVQVKKNPNYIAGKELYVNKEEYHDGSAVYGIIANSRGPAVFGFGTSPNEEAHDGQDLTLNNVNIRGLKVVTNEIPALSFDKCNGADTISNIQSGPFQHVFDLRKVLSESDAALIESYSTDNDILNGISYIGNPLADAQIALQVFREYVPGQDFGFRSNIDELLISWAKGETAFPSACAEFICNGDIMFHTNKGIVGARIDGIENVKIMELVVKYVVNKSPLASNACGNYSGSHNGGSTDQENGGGMLTDIRGVLISNSDVEFIGPKNKIFKLNSWHGDTTALDIINDAHVDFDVGSHIEIHQLYSATELDETEYNALVSAGMTPYPNNFDLCTINIEDTSVVTGYVPEGLNASNCIAGKWNNSLPGNGLMYEPPQSIGLPDQFEPSSKYQPQPENYHNDYNEYNSDYQPRNDQPSTVIISATTFEIICGVSILILFCNVYVMYQKCKVESRIIKYAGIEKVATDTEQEYINE